MVSGVASDLEAFGQSAQVALAHPHSALKLYILWGDVERAGNLVCLEKPGNAVVQHMSVVPARRDSYGRRTTPDERVGRCSRPC
jgi:hypothetical protein